MRILFTLILIGAWGIRLFPCNCPPPFPNLRKDKGDTNYYKSYRIKNSNISGIVQIISAEEKVRIIIDTEVCRKRYYHEIKKKNIDPNYTTLIKYLQEQSLQLKMRMYKAVLIKDYKANEIGDIVYLFSDYSNCGMYFTENEYYEIYGSKLENRNYEIDVISTSKPQDVIQMNSCIVSRCSAEYIDFDKLEK
jgi:hypothetical protein